MSQLRLIDANPATEAYQRGMQFSQQQKAGDLQIEGRMLNNAESFAAAPHRLRTVEASADVAGVNARYAEPNAAAGLRSANAGATTAEVNAQYAAPRAQAGLRQQNAAALNIEMQGFYKSLELLNVGDPASATEVARRTGQELPAEVVQDAELRQAVTQIAARAQQLYPSRPADQQQFIQGQMQGLKDRAERGEQIFAPTTPYQMPEGAPPPPEMAGNAQRNPPADVAMAEWLIGNGVAQNPAEAWDMVRKARTNPDAIRAQIFARAMTPAMGQRNWEAFLKAGEEQAPQAPAPQAPAPPAAPAGPSAAPQQQGQAPMPGMGTREQPFQATTQEQVEWFKQSAPPSSVISVEGRLYAK